MNAAAEGLFAAVGAFVVIAVPIVLLVALVNRLGHDRKPAAAQAAKAQGEYPPPRNHEAGECWCGDEHADALAGDGEPAYRVS